MADNKLFRPLRIRWGNYVHRINEGDLRISREPVMNIAKKVCAVRELWQWSGRIKFESTSIASQMKAMSAFEYAYAVNGKDLVLETIDGVGTWHQLLTSNCIGGTKVVSPPSFPNSRGNDAVGYRTYTVGVEGVMPVIGRSMILQFSETISIRGGGKRWGVREVNNGPGVRQQIRTHTACTATQSGSMTMYIGEPQIPPPIWPYALVDELPDLDTPNPVSESGLLVNRTRSWGYSYVWPYRLSGEPHYPITF